MTESFWPGLHVLLVLAAYALFALAFLSGLLHLATRRQLKSHAASPWLDMMPSLESSLRINRVSVLSGFLLLTLGIVVGYMYARNVVSGSEWRLDPKVLVATFTWLCYLAVLALHAARRGRSGVAASIGSFAAVLLSLWTSIAWSEFHRF